MVQDKLGTAMLETDVWGWKTQGGGGPIRFGWYGGAPAAGSLESWKVGR